MKTDRDDRMLMERFAALREQDGAVLPDFDGILRPRPAGGRAILPAGWRIAALAALALAVVGLPFLRRASAPDEAELQRWAVLTGWHATTDSLLETTDLPWGNPWTTKTDAWIQSGSDASDNAPNGATETL